MPSTLAVPNRTPASMAALPEPQIHELPIKFPGEKASAKLSRHKECSESSVEARFAPFASKMRKAEMPLAVIRAFRHYYEELLTGADGYISLGQSQPLLSLPEAAEDSRYWQAGYAALRQTVVIKLNGGLGTTMGMQAPKSAIRVKKGLSFLDIAINQIFTLRRKYRVGLPLVLMNSFYTDTQTQAMLKNYKSTHHQAPLTFIQNQAPKVWQKDLAPAAWPADASKEWCPPGHGDLYLALHTSGMLRKLLAQGHQYAFVSNIDNLGATLDLNILGYIASNRISFLMEAARRQAVDRKGGHLAQRPNGELLLRELAQCPPAELEEFQDLQRYGYFNTNNLWLHLPTLQRLLERYQGVLPLPLIRNEKPIDPAQPNSPAVYQLETAMGHAISLFPGAQAVEVQRERFFPVKTTNDLLALWSDAYVLNEDYSIRLNPARQLSDAPIVDLDKKYYGMFHQLKARFPYYVPSLLNCARFQVKGNIYFDSKLALEGDVSLQQMGDTPLQVSAVPNTEQDKHFAEFH